MKISLLRLSLFVSVLGAALSASAQTSFYGGDFDRADGLLAYMGGGIDARVYEDFTLGSTTNVDNVFGNFLTNSNITGLHYEIRSGVSLGDGGTLLFSGDLAASVLDTGVDAFNFSLLRITGSPVGVSLAAGTYHLGLAAIGGSGSAYLATTSGANSVGGPITNGNAFFDSPNFGANFAPSTNFGGTRDFSAGINAVPEPASMVALGLGALAMVRRRRKA